MADELTVLIVDDEPLAAERLQLLCAQLPGLRLAGIAHDGAAALRMVDALSPDVLLLDIAMPELSGMDVARALDGRASRPGIIFVTAFDGYAVAAFDTDAVDYVQKPVSPERLARAFDRVRAHRANTAPADPWTREFWVPVRGELVRLAARAIERIEADRDYMRLIAQGRSYLLHTTATELEARLDPADFIRIHRSVILRRDTILSLRHDGAGIWSAVTANGAWRIGRSYLKSVQAMARPT
ncbi:LytR/AlgR family response regulator transcription factor [Sandaracinobacteroides saxicola]|uniref:Response regulator transcription factor n=1 Tax=Sandaracinobacteroides saxicola TaxID=2759707 RepID=A0A7G5IJG9_9SPHN|nr:LytTR family DNA-binding domain-containing protein [Sandaracinobacteroides saxicola]QMW23511.1 response regulator transcription factor [Sandaracinobacteroides saxicola]